MNCKRIFVSLLLFTIPFLTGCDLAQPPSKQIPDTKNTEGTGAAPVVFWPTPVYAHTGIPLNFTMVAFDQENDVLTFSLIDAPAGMTINSEGTIHWPAQDVEGAYTFQISVDDGQQKPVTLSTTLYVDDANFLFVAPNGDNNNPGTIIAPLADIETGLSKLAELGKGTLVIRGGTYQETWVWETNGKVSPTNGAHGNPQQPFVVMGYPGEEVILDAGGHGFWTFNASYWLYKNLTVINAQVGERAGMMLGGHHNIAQEVTVKDADWSRSENCTGFLLRGNRTICHRCTAIDNYDRTSDHWNSSNFLVYADNTDDNTFVIDSHSEGSIVGYKIKHAGAGSAVFHGNVDDSSVIGFGGADDDSLVQFNHFRNNQSAIYVGVADPNDYTKGDMIIQRNTVLNASVENLEIQTTYAQDSGIEFSDNVIKSDSGFSTNNSPANAVTLWRYTPTEDIPAQLLTADGNCWIGPSTDDAFLFGQNNALTFAQWQSLGFGPNSHWETDLNALSGDNELNANSICFSETHPIGANSHGM